MVSVARMACLTALLSTLAAGARAEALDTPLLDRILQRHTREVGDPAGVRVDYAGLARSEDWRRLIENLARTDPDRLATRAEQLAFWINAYNVLAIDLVLQHRPVESIRDIGSFLRPVWKRPAGRVGGRNVSLDEIEHGTLRPMGEPRIHAAIVCASVSCPPLRRAAFTASDLDAQLDAAMRRWLADPVTGLRIDRTQRTLHLSRVFDWFEADFADSGGVLAFIRPYLGAADRAWLAQNPRPRIDHLDYDWRLNALPPDDPGE